MLGGRSARGNINMIKPRSILFLLLSLLFINSCIKGNQVMFGKKEFKFKAEQIKPIATGYGACFATNMITIEGKK